MLADVEYRKDTSVDTEHMETKAKSKSWNTEDTERTENTEKNHNEKTAIPWHPFGFSPCALCSPRPLCLQICF